MSDLAVSVTFKVDRDSLVSVAARIIGYMISEHDWPEDQEEPSTRQLADRITSRTWVLNDLRAQLRANGVNLDQVAYDQLDADHGASRRREIFRHAERRIGELFPEFNPASTPPGVPG